MMKNLLNYSGRRFRCKLHGKPVEGKIQVEHGYVFLCQNEIDGCRARNKLGYKYSYSVDSGSGGRTSRFTMFPISLCS